MSLANRRGGLVLALGAAVALVVLGCGKGEGTKPAGSDGARGRDGDAAAARKDQGAEKKVHDHSEWWCAEHGIPEHLCSLCSEKVAAECKKKGDWCDKHDRARSQCFLCEPKLKEKFAAMYRAKYGKEPPPVEEGAARDTPRK